MPVALTCPVKFTGVVKLNCPPSTACAVFADKVSEYVPALKVPVWLNTTSELGKENVALVIVMVDGPDTT